MFNRTKVVDSLFGIVGFTQPFNPSFPVLEADNLASSSGYMVNQISYAKLEYFVDASDYKDQSDVQVNTLIRELQKQSITAVMNGVFNLPDFRERNLLYTHAQNKVNTETLPDGFIGYRIRVTAENNVAFSIPRVLLDFDGTGSIELLLWNTGSQTPVESKVIAITTEHQVEELGWVLDNSGNTYKGEYYLGYNTTALTVQPFKRDYELSNVQTCYGNIVVEDIQVPNHNTNVLFDLTKRAGNSKATGINPDISIYDDYTDWIIANKDIFARAIYLDTAVKILSASIGSLRSNRNERKGSDLAKMVLALSGEEGAENGGLQGSLLQEMGRLRSEVKKLKVGLFGGPIMVDTLS